MKTLMSLALLFAALLVVSPVPQGAQAQTVTLRSQLRYYEDDMDIRCTSQTLLDYSAAAYYDPRVEYQLSQAGQVVRFGSSRSPVVTNGESATTTNVNIVASAGTRYDLVAYHNLYAIYWNANFDGGPYSEADWEDPYDFAQTQPGNYGQSNSNTSPSQEGGYEARHVVISTSYGYRISDPSIFMGSTNLAVYTTPPAI